jgi:hypothetical protein
MPGAPVTLDPAADPAPKPRRDTPLCPSCREKGLPVGAVTLDILLTVERLLEAYSTEGFRFCRTRECEVVWYRSEGNTLHRVDDVSVRVGQKETAPDRPVCYCFDFAADQIEEEVASAGVSVIPDDIEERCRQGLDRCEETNPQGVCCLGNVRRVMKEAQAKRAARTAPQAPAVAAACCTPTRPLGS